MPASISEENHGKKGVIWPSLHMSFQHLMLPVQSHCVPVCFLVLSTLSMAHWRHLTKGHHCSLQKRAVLSHMDTSFRFSEAERTALEELKYIY